MESAIHFLVDQAGVGLVNDAIGSDAALVILGLAAAIVTRAHVTADNLAVFGDPDAFS